MYLLWAVIYAMANQAAHATFHTYRISELYSNVDGSVQFIDLKEAFGFNGQNFLAGHTISVTQGQTTHTFTFPTNLPNGNTANTSVLIATPGFAQLGIVTPDYIVPEGFLFAGGGTVNYAGVDSLSYPSLPTDGVNSLYRDGTIATNLATNFAGQTGSVAAPPLAYTPVTPCRLVDTRVAGGASSPRAARAFSATQTSLIAAAGGNAAGCGIPVGPEALALTLTAVAPPQVGNLVAYADGSPVPLASALNFLAGQIIANTTVVPSTSTLGPNFDIFNNSDGATDVVVDIVGYFWEYQASDCTKVTNTQSVSAGGATDVAATCAAGYVPVGGGCSTDTAGASNWLTRTATAPGDGYHCWMLNGSAGSVNVSTDTMCCRRAGR
jgi:hypothetical protein